MLAIIRHDIRSPHLCWLVAVSAIVNSMPEFEALASAGLIELAPAAPQSWELRIHSERTRMGTPEFAEIVRDGLRRHPGNPTIRVYGWLGGVPEVAVHAEEIPALVLGLPLGPLRDHARMIAMGAAEDRLPRDLCLRVVADFFVEGALGGLTPEQLDDVVYLAVYAAALIGHGALIDQLLEHEAAGWRPTVSLPWIALHIRAGRLDRLPGLLGELVLKDGIYPPSDTETLARALQAAVEAGHADELAAALQNANSTDTATVLSHAILAVLANDDEIMGRISPEHRTVAKLIAQRIRAQLPDGRVPIPPPLPARPGRRKKRAA